MFNQNHIDYVREFFSAQTESIFNGMKNLTDVQLEIIDINREYDGLNIGPYFVQEYPYKFVRYVISEATDYGDYREFGDARFFDEVMQIIVARHKEIYMEHEQFANDYYNSLHC